MEGHSRALATAERNRGARRCGRPDQVTRAISVVGASPDAGFRAAGHLAAGCRFGSAACTTPAAPPTASGTTRCVTALVVTGGTADRRLGGGERG